MQDETDSPIPRMSNIAGMIILLGGIPVLGLVLHAMAGPVVAAAVCGLYALALLLALLAERRDGTLTRDPSTGLPDRNAAIVRLEGIFAQRLAGSSQAAVFVVSLDGSEETGARMPDTQTGILAATARLAQGLRRGDQIIRIGERSLAAILGPSRGLTAPAAEGILDRIDAIFREPIRIGPRTLEIRVSIGACLQHDAPRADAKSWIEAAELAAEVAREDREPRLFPSGATKVDRSAWDVVLGLSSDAAETGAWTAARDAHADDTKLCAGGRRRESA